MRAQHWQTGPFLSRQTNRRRSKPLAFETCEERRLLTVAVSSIGLMSDTGVSNSDQITNTPTITGSTSGSPPPYGWAEVQFDYFSNGSVDGSATVSGGSFSYTPPNSLGIGTWEGTLAMQYRVVEHSYNGSVVSTGNWSTFNIVLDRVAPTSTGFSTLTVDENSADSQIALNPIFADGYSPDANLQYQVLSNNNSSLFDSVTIANGTLTLNYAANHFGSAVVTVRCTDQAGNSWDSTLSVNVNRVNDPPTIAGFTVTHLENGKWTLSGTVSDDANLAGCLVHFGGVFAGYDFTATIGSNGAFSVIVECGLTFSGTATAIAYDCDNAASNEATYWVTL